MPKRELLKLPLVAIRNVVIFPNVITPLFIGREVSINAINESVSTGGQVFVTTQINAGIEDVDVANLYSVGVICNIAHISRIANTNEQKVILDPISRIRFERMEFDAGKKILYAEGYELEEVAPHQDEAQISAMRGMLGKIIGEYINISAKVPNDVASLIAQVEKGDAFVDVASSITPGDVKFKQKILEELDLLRRMEIIYSAFVNEINILNYETKIQGKVKASLTKYQKESYIKEQINVLKKELDGLDENGGTELEKYEKLLRETPLSKEAEARVKEEIKKLGTISNLSSEGSIVKAYLDCVFALPWGKVTQNEIDISKAREILDENHYGMQKVKGRILEYISVQSRMKKPQGAILCLYGPPGVGKTSLVQSIAKAMGREYVKISLGGMRDEAEIRGHRKTYIGAFPGKIISALKKAGTSNPVVLLDEIDKISDSYKGDPAAALLEVLDPEQNKSFQDNYLEFAYDLSNIIFIATANSLNISYPLLDRMDTIELSGYTELEKLSIAEKYLLPKVIKHNGLHEGEMEFASRDGVFLDIIRYYTREAGVRTLERQIGILVRRVLKKILEESLTSVTINPEHLKDYLGIRRYDFERQNTEDMIGVTTGLAYTEFGGDILMIEAIRTKDGKGEIKTTGKLGDVMKESMQAAFSYIQSHAEKFGIDPAEMLKYNIHVHVPEGATPKDGPSAGIAIMTSLISIFTGRKVSKTVAMTGEITLRGKVLPIGGLKEKLMSAVRSNIKTVLIPSDNQKDLEDVPEEIKEKLHIVPVSYGTDVVKEALL